MHIIAGQEVQSFTCNADGTMGPFVNNVTNEPVTPESVIFKFRLEPLFPTSVGPTNSVVQGTPLNYDEFNPAMTIEYDEVSGGFYIVMVTTLWLATAVVVPPTMGLRTLWESNDPSNPAVSQSKVDTIYPADL
jgi:hypothetical protein